jgi:cis-3-alkyl-4-acyloxetan-2-one decarboxylase
MKLSNPRSSIALKMDQFHSLPSGLRYHYIDEGQGSPVVMVHGNPSWSIYYRNLVEALSSNHRCIVPDHIGCGFSDKPDDSTYAYTLSQRIEDLESLLESLNLSEPITLVVHDWGGAIGMGYATRHPEKIARLVILNTAAFHQHTAKPGAIPPALRLGRNTRLGAWLIHQHNAFSIAASWVGCKIHPMSKALRQAYQLPYNTPAHRLATLRFVQDIPLSPNDPAFETLSAIEDNLSLFTHTPMLICWGMKDFVFDKDFLAVWEARFPEADIYRFLEAGHYILEDASEEVIPLIQHFLSGELMPSLSARTDVSSQLSHS